MRFFVVAFLLVPGFLLAQSGKNLKGQVSDAETGEPLVGASILVEGTNKGANTDGDGSFLVEKVEGASVNLRVSYVGYQEITRTINLRLYEGDAIRFDLLPSSVELAQVEVTGRMTGNIRALADMKRAENIKNIMAAEQIATFPDMNAAESMSRLPGITLQRDQGEGRFVQLRGTPPELTVFNINGEQIPSPEGDVRYVGMDIIPSDQIEAIEVNKVMTPDMDADGIGGMVNIITKNALSQEPEIRATLAAGRNNLRGTPNYQAQFSFGQRYQKLGFQVNASFYENQQGSDNIEFDYAKGPFFGSQDEGVDNYSVQYREVQHRHYDLTRTRISVAPTLDYAFNENSSIYLKGMYNRFTDAETRRRLIYDLDDALSFTYYLYGGVEHDTRQRTKQQELSTLALGGEHRLGPAFLDYQLFYAYAREEEPDFLQAVFDSPGQAIAIRFDLSQPDYPRASFPNENNANFVTDYEHYELDELLFENSLTEDVNLTPRLNVRFPYVINGQHDGYLKFGGKIRYKDKSRDIRAQQFGAYFEESNVYPGRGEPYNLLVLDDGFREDNLLDQGYVLEYMPGPDPLRDHYEFNPQYYIIDRNGSRTQSYGEDYQAEEMISAVYGMVRHDWNRLMVLGGLRYERTDIDYQGFYVRTNGNRFLGIDTLSDQRTHEFLLPQVQMRYAINPDFNLRAALTYSYSRPNFEDVLPYREQDRDEVTFGNPDLTYPSSMNADIMLERYFRQGILSAGLFYKRIDDFIFYFKRFAHEGDPANFGLVEITKAVNGNKAFVYGAELQAQFPFDFLPGFWKRFGIYTNYTYTYSEAYINQRLPANYTDAVVDFENDDLDAFTDSDEEEVLPLPGQARHTANLAFFYDSPKVFARITANFQDDFLLNLGADADLDEYYDQTFRLDFTANYFLTDNIKIFTDLINLTNAPLRIYLGQDERFIKQLEYYSWWGRAGVKLQF